MPPRLSTATSVVPPPMSTIMEPVGSYTGRPAPSAAAMGSSISSTSCAPALRTASSTARRSTSVTPEGTLMTTRVLENMERLSERKIKLWSISAVISKSAMTPFFSGRTATMEPGVRPIICLAWVPVATTRLVFTSTATTLGSRTIMRPLRSQIMVVAVPKSIPISLDKIICILSLSKTGAAARCINFQR